jgi:hypothetical protein
MGELSSNAFRICRGNRRYSKDQRVWAISAPTYAEISDESYLCPRRSILAQRHFAQIDVHCTCSKEQDPKMLGLPGLWKPIEFACEGAVL